MRAREWELIVASDAASEAGVPLAPLRAARAREEASGRGLSHCEARLRAVRLPAAPMAKLRFGR